MAKAQTVDSAIPVFFRGIHCSVPWSSPVFTLQSLSTEDTYHARLDWSSLGGSLVDQAGLQSQTDLHKYQVLWGCFFMICSWPFALHSEFSISILSFQFKFLTQFSLLFFCTVHCMTMLAWGFPSCIAVQTIYSNKGSELKDEARKANSCVLFS